MVAVTGSERMEELGVVIGVPLGRQQGGALVEAAMAIMVVAMVP